MIKEFSLNEAKRIKDFTELNRNLNLNNEDKNVADKKNIELSYIERDLDEKKEIDKTNEKRIYNAELEKEVKNLWREVLGLDEIGIEDNFFSLGGTSLNMIQLSNKILERYNYQIDFGEFLENSTIYNIVLKISDYLEKE